VNFDPSDYSEAMLPHVHQIFDGQYYVNLREPPDSVLDIGANEGGFTDWAHQTWPGAIIYAYEPMPENIARFEKNPLLRRWNIHLMKCAVTGDGRPVELWRGKNNSGEASVHNPRKGSPENVESVKASMLRACELIKIDTEGCELEILEHLDLSRAKALAVEYHSDKAIESLTEICRKAGLTETFHNRLAPDRGILKFAKPDAVNGWFQPGRKKLFVALPVYGQVDPFFTQSMQRLLMDPPCSIVVKYEIGDSLIPRARNRLAQCFLESDCTDLLFIDSDLIFSAAHVKRIMSHMEPLVGGFYPKKQSGDPHWVCNYEVPVPDPREDGLQELVYIGTGFMRISRTVFEQMLKQFGPALEYRCDDTGRLEHDFFSVGAFKGRYLSEDWYFCQRWRDLGGKVWGDTKFFLKHVGMKIYPGIDICNALLTPKPLT
jgi:FkbM family methyltransferase